MITVRLLLAVAVIAVVLFIGAAQQSMTVASQDPLDDGRDPTTTTTLDDGRDPTTTTTLDDGRDPTTTTTLNDGR